MNPLIAFIVPVRDDAARLDRCLRSIQANSQRSGDIDIVVMDNGSLDDSADVARRRGARVVHVAQARIAELRNLGARQSTAPVLAFVDADHEIVADWVPVALQVLDDFEVGMTGALCLPPTNGTWVQRGYGFLRARPPIRKNVSWLGSGNMVITRRAFDAVEGFDATLEACEDVDLCQRVRARGFRIVSEPRLGNIHYGDPETLRALFRGERWRGRDNLRVSFRRPLVWSGLPSAMIPIVDALMLAIVAICLLLLPFWNRGLPLAIGAALFVAGGAGLKVIKAAAVNPPIPPTAVAAAWIVSAVYSIARACSLFTKAPHRRARREAPIAAS